MCDKAFLFSTNEEFQFIRNGDAIYRNDEDVTDDRYGRIVFLVEQKNTDHPLAQIEGMEERFPFLTNQDASLNMSGLDSPQYVPDYSPPDSPMSPCRSPVYTIWNPAPYSPSRETEYEDEPYSPYLCNSPSYVPYSPSPINHENMEEENSIIEIDSDGQPIKLKENIEEEFQPIEFEEIQPMENQPIEIQENDEEIVLIERCLRLPINMQKSI